MVQDQKQRGFRTVYDSGLDGGVAFEISDAPEERIQAYGAVLAQLLEDFKTVPAAVEGLRQIQRKLQALRISKLPKQELEKKLDALVTVPIGPGKTVRLDAFRKTASQGVFRDGEKYRIHVRKLVRNTIANITHLLLTYPDDIILEKFLVEVQNIPFDGTDENLRTHMGEIGKSSLLSHYNEKKKEFLLEWLRPYQEQIGKEVTELTEEEIQSAIKKVDELRSKKLEEMTHLQQENDRERFRAENRTMHAVINGANIDFWSDGEVRDEFVRLVNQLLARFALSLEDGFLLFKTKDKGFAYLVGFADEAFDHMKEVKGGKLAIVPHVKPFLKSANGEYIEIQQSTYAENPADYYGALKTAVVPFLSSMAVMLEQELSKSIREAFDMWV